MSEAVLKTKRDLRREQILKIAGEVFMEEGFAVASMSAIAARLGGSKGTLYNYFESKEDLLEAFVRDCCLSFWDRVFSFAGEDLPVRELLVNVGESYLKQLDEDVVRFVRMLIGEAQRIPELTRIFYDTGPRAKALRLADYLEAAKARGEFEAEDCKAAARQFLALVRGAFYFERLLNVNDPDDQAAARAEIKASVDLFLKAYPPRG